MSHFKPGRMCHFKPGRVHMYHFKPGRIYVAFLTRSYVSL